MDEHLPPVEGAPYPDYPTPPLDDLADIPQRGADEFADAPAFAHADGRVTTYAQLARKVSCRRAELARTCPGRAVEVAAADPEAFAVDLLAAWAERRVGFLGGTLAHARGAGADLDADALLRDAACVLGSSGTTGAPKLVVLTRAGVLADLLAGLARFAFEPHGRYVALVPRAHAFGLVCDTLAVLATGGTLCVPSAPLAFMAQLPGFAPTALNVPPQVADMLLGALQAQVAAGKGVPEARRAVCGGDLRKLMCGGAGFSPRVASGLRAFGLEAHGCYGLTECSPCVSINREGHRRDGSAGLPLGVNEVRTAPDGEILVRGANVMAGYLGRPDLAAHALRDGWLHTGDVGRLDAAGFLWVHGRKDARVALADGTLVSPEAWERALCELPGVRQALVRGEDDARGQTVLTARVCAAPDARPAEVAQACRGVSPDGVHLLARVDVTSEPLSCTALGKTRR